MSDVSGKIALLRSKNAPAACAACAELVELSAQSSEVYPFFDEIAELLYAKSSLERNRALALLSSLARWDGDNKLERVIAAYLGCISDPKPITARQCVKALPELARFKPSLRARISAALESADVTSYADSMRPLVERDIALAIKEIDEMNGENVD